MHGYNCCCSVTKLCPSHVQIVSNYLQPHGLQHTRLLCPPLSPGVCSNSYPLSWWCYLTVSSSAASFCLQSFQASGSFPMSQLFASGGQSLGASATVLPMNIQGWFPLGFTISISLLSKGLSRVFSSITVWNQFFGAQPSVSIWKIPFMFLSYSLGSYHSNSPFKMP